MALENPFINPPETEGEKKFQEREAEARAGAAQRAKEAQKRAGESGWKPEKGGNTAGRVDLTEDLERHTLDEGSFEEKQE